MFDSCKRAITRREFLQAGAMGAVATLLAACGPQPTAQVVEKEATRIVEKVVTPTPAPKGAVTLEFWQPFGDLWGQVIDQLIATWNERNADVQVKVTFTPNVTSAGSNPKFLSAALSGNPPDLFIHDGSSFSTSTALNAFAPLDDLVQSAGLNPDSYFKWSWDKVQWNGHIYGLPFNTDARALYWNKRAFQEAGLDKPPATIDELDTMAEKLTRKSGERLERMGFIPWAGNWFLIAWGWNWGGQLFDAATNKIALNCPEMVSALEWEVTYAQKYGVSQLQAFQSSFGDGANDPFLRELLAMCLTGDWIIGVLEQYTPDLEYDIAPPPYPAGRSPITWSGGFVAGIPAASKQIEEAWKFLTWFTGPESESLFATMTRSLPCNVEAATALAAAEPKHKVFVDLLPVSFIEPVIPEWSLAWDEHIAAEQAAIYGQKTAKEALDAANEKVQKAIDARVSASE